MKLKILISIVIMLACVGCAPRGGDGESDAGHAAGVSHSSTDDSRIDFAIAIHGGAGYFDPATSIEDQQKRLDGLSTALERGRTILAEGGTSLEAVEQVLRLLEDDSLFNAGRGSVFSSAGKNELDAAIMDGATLECGAISGVTTVRHPITLARHVMNDSRHVFFVADGAETFADEMKVERVDQEFFFVQERYDAWRRAVERREKEVARLRPQNSSSNLADFGTVGAVALDTQGNLAAGTSTGGMTDKRYGRVGDVPIIGAGTYANNESVAVSCTGHGEQFIRNTVASEVSALMRYAGTPLPEAADTVLARLEPGAGGLIAVSKTGEIVMPFTSGSMFRGAADSSGRFDVAIWPDDQE